MTQRAELTDHDVQHCADVTSRNLAPLLVELIDATLPRDGHPALLVAFSMACLHTVTEMYRATVDPQRLAEAEQMALGYVRAAMRGSRVPIYDDGTPLPEEPPTLN